jgi:hypothetical protein
VEAFKFKVDLSLKLSGTVLGCGALIPPERVFIAMSLLDSIKVLAGKIGPGRSHTIGSECPHEADILAYSEDRLSHRRREQLEGHFLGCDDCRDFLALFARNSDDATLPDLKPLTDNGIKDQTARILTYIKEDEFNRRRPDRINPLVEPSSAGLFVSNRPRGAGAGFFVSTRQLVTIGLIFCALAVATVYFVTMGEPNNKIAMQAVVLATKGERRIEPRLSGGLPYSPYPITDTRGGGVEVKNLRAEVQFDRAQVEVQYAESPSAPVEDRLTLARVWLARGEPDYTQRALDILEQLVASGAQSPELLNDTGVAMFQLKRYDEAINYFNQALEKSPGFNEALFNRAMARQKAGNKAEAREDWNKFIETSSNEKWNDEARRRMNMK